MFPNHHSQEHPLGTEPDLLRSRLRGTPHLAENTWLFPSTTGQGRTHRDVSVTAGASLHSGLLLWTPELSLGTAGILSHESATLWPAMGLVRDP